VLMLDLLYLVDPLAMPGLVLAAIPAALVTWNLLLYRPPPKAPAAGRRRALPSPADGSLRASVLVPARNEEGSISRLLDSVLASRDVELEVLVMDDHSEDRTAAVVEEIAGRDERVRLVKAPPLPAGWCGKQHACFELASRARHEALVFVDSDVTLRPEGVARLLRAARQSGADLVSGFPRQETETWLERLLIPLIHFVLLGFLPFAGMRRSGRPAFGAGCGQVFVVRRDAYWRAGGHAVIRASRHDGIALPRAFRAAGARTELFDLTDVASCRMYRDAREVWRGLAKNATEGMASPGGIVPWSVLLLGGQVLPPALLVASLVAGTPSVFAAVATLLGCGTRAVLALRFRQSWLGVALHPLGVSLLVTIQWYALGLELLGRPVSWKGRQPSQRESSLAA
jgi:hypothetical protein